MRKDIDEKKDWIISELKKGTPRFELCRELKCKYDTLLTRLKVWGVTDLKNPSGKGIPKFNCRVHSSAYLGSKGKPIHSHKLKLNLVRDGIKEWKCEECGIVTWRGKPIPLELDHSNGDHWDNRLENLRILCPNCHSQSEFNSGRKNKKEVVKNEQSACGGTADTGILGVSSERSGSSNLPRPTKIKPDRLEKVYKVSEEHRLTQKLSLKKINHQQGPINSQFGTIWITNGTENKKVKGDTLIPEGWRRGRTL